MAAQSKTTVIYRVQVTQTSYVNQQPCTRTYLKKNKYKIKRNAEYLVNSLTYTQHDSNSKLVFESIAVLISHTATAPLH